MKRKLLVFAGTAAAARRPGGSRRRGLGPDGQDRKRDPGQAEQRAAARHREPQRCQHHLLLPVGPDDQLRHQRRARVGRPRSQGAGHQPVRDRARPGTTYHYRLVATNEFGTTVGGDRTFKTTGHAPPGAVTGAAIRLSSTSATLVGAVFPGSETTLVLPVGHQHGLRGADHRPEARPSATAQLVLSPLTGLVAPERSITSGWSRAIWLGGLLRSGCQLHDVFRLLARFRAWWRAPSRSTPSRAVRAEHRRRRDRAVIDSRAVRV